MTTSHTPPPASSVAAIAAPANPAADAAARCLIDAAATYLSRRLTVTLPARRPLATSCDCGCHAAAWGLLAQLDSATTELDAVRDHAAHLREVLG